MILKHKELSSILLLSVCWKTIVNKNEILF